MRMPAQLVLAIAITALAGNAYAKKKPTAPPDHQYRVFVGDSETFFASSSGFANGNTAAHSSYAGTEKWTVMAMKALHENCSKLIIVDKPETADYLVRLDRNGAFIRLNAMAVFNKAGEMVYVGAGVALTKQAKRFCQKLP